MAKSIVSPGVFTNEVDASFLGAGVGAIGAALIGTAPQGPAFVPVTVTNYSEYASYFGELDTDHLLGYAARAYLKNAGSANIVRVLGPEGRTANGTSVTAGYTAESMWAICGKSGSAESILALLEVTASSGIVVTDSTADEFILSGTGVMGGMFGANGVTLSFKEGNTYIGDVLNTDPTLFSTYGYYLREVYDYVAKQYNDYNATFTSASYPITNFQTGYSAAYTPWIKSQQFGGETEYNLFRFHTLGHGEVENGRFKVSITNIKPSAAPDVNPYGKFDLEVRVFDDKDKSPSRVEAFPNLSLDPTDTGYILRAIGDKVWSYDTTNDKMVETGDYANRSKLIRVEMATTSAPTTALPWGFRGLAKPVLSTGSITSAVKDLPYVADLLDKEGNGSYSNKVYWGMESVMSGSVVARMSYLPSMTGSDADFSLAYVSGNAEHNMTYNASNPAGSKKSPGETLSHTVLDSTYARFTVPLAFGFDGFDRRKANPLNNETELLAITQLGTQALRQAVDIISDPDFIDINLLAIPGIYSSKVVDYAIQKVEDRADAFYVADISGSTATAIVQEVRGRGFDTNYAGLYYPGIKIYDDINKVAKSIPASIAAVGAIAFNDRVSYPWFAPAGLNRAGLSKDTIGFDVLNVSDQLKQSERDSLYENRVNPIARFPDVPQGVIWGQKTLQLKASALDRINVRRLLIKAKKLVASSVKYLVFEQANATTMTRFKQLINPLLQDIQQKQGLDTFLVKMDSTTTTPDMIDRNMLKGQIFLVPTRSAEFIAVDFIISPTGTTFSE